MSLEGCTNSSRPAPHDASNRARARSGRAGASCRQTRPALHACEWVAWVSDSAVAHLGSCVHNKVRERYVIHVTATATVVTKGPLTTCTPHHHDRSSFLPGSSDCHRIRVWTRRARTNNDRCPLYPSPGLRFNFFDPGTLSRSALCTFLHSCSTPCRAPNCPSSAH